MPVKSKREMKVIAARFPKSSVDELEQIAKEERVDRSAIIVRALEGYIRSWKLEKALTLYCEERVTLWKAASIAGVSIWEMIDTIRDRKIPIQYTFEDFKQDFEAALKEK